MKSEQEAQQTQTIADAREHKERRGCVDYHIIERDMWNLLEIVDSQAQKIAEQEKEIERLSKRGVRKYSEEELETIEEFADGLKYFPDYRSGFLSALRFLGALEGK